MMISWMIIIVSVIAIKGCKSEDSYCSSNEEFCTTRNSERACRIHDIMDFSENSSFRSFVVPIIRGGTTVNMDYSESFHMAALAFYSPGAKIYKFNCGGSLISRTFVLTAAHCIVNPDQEEVIFVRLGSIFVPRATETIDFSQDIRVKNVIVHENFRRLKRLNDIALIELEKSVRFSRKIRPICLYSRDDRIGKMVALGWGATNLAGERIDLLQKVVVTTVPSEECEKSYYRKLGVKIESSHICAGNDERNTCEGDSGGPLQARLGGTWYIVGVTAAGGWCSSRMPGIYTRVSSFLDWIEDHVWPQETILSDRIN